MMCLSRCAKSGVKRNFSLEKYLITRHLRVRRVVFQVMHFAAGHCSMKYQICRELMFRVMVRIYGLPSGFRVRVTVGFRAAMSKPNDLLGQKVCHSLDQSRTLKAISMRAAH